MFLNTFLYCFPCDSEHVYKFLRHVVYLGMHKKANSKTQYGAALTDGDLRHYTDSSGTLTTHLLSAAVDLFISPTNQ